MTRVELYAARCPGCGARVVAPAGLEPGSPFETTQCGSNHVYVTCDDHHIDFRLAVLNGTRKAEVHYVKRYIMRNARNFHRILFRVVPLGLVIGLVLTATQAYGYYGGRHGGHQGYGYYGGYHGGQYRHSYGRHRYGYYPYRYGGRYRYSYGRRYGYYPYRYRGAYGSYSTTPPVTAPGSQGAAPNGGAYGGNAAIPPTTGPDYSGVSRNSSPGTLDGGGWARLAEGRYSQALSIFAAEARNRPSAGRPKVGYALSTAAGGDLRRGVWAMRRALGVDPEYIHYMTIDEPLRSRVAQLITRYRDNDGAAVRNAEAAFMLASLHYLLGDRDSARIAIDLAVADGDRSSSTGNLKRLIDAGLTPDTQHERRADPRPSADGTLRSADAY